MFLVLSVCLSVFTITVKLLTRKPCAGSRAVSIGPGGPLCFLTEGHKIKRHTKLECRLFYYLGQFLFQLLAPVQSIAWKDSSESSST